VDRSEDHQDWTSRASGIAVGVGVDNAEKRLWLICCGGAACDLPAKPRECPSATLTSSAC